MDSSPPLSGYRIPAWLMVFYGVLLFTLGWIASGLWEAWHRPEADSVRSHALPAPSREQASNNEEVGPVCDDNTLLPLRYSAHVWADAPAQRSVTLNAKQYREGDTLPCGEEVVAIEPTALVLHSLGRRMQLDAMWDWPGGAVDSIVINDEDMP
ncbi:general secretion pathway protein GspB [Enterobacteriaceae bacterium 4M9]|nr:general secretion pathway protein GspB [Enterobacteriaceae bacterium 4M9]